MKLRELIDLRARKARELRDLSLAETFGDEEQKRYDGIKAEIKDLDAKIDRAREADGIDAATPAVPEERALPRLAAPKGEQAPVITDMHNRAEDDPAHGYRTPREFFLDVLEAGVNHRIADRLRTLRAAGSDEQAGYTGGYGGFLVPTAFMPNLMQVAAEADFISGRTFKVPMQAPKVEIEACVDKTHTNSVTGGLRFYRREEAAAIVASRTVFEKITLHANSLAGLAFATNEILTDSPLSFAAILEQKFKTEYASHMLHERIWGTGVGECEGVMNSPALVTIAKEDAQTADTINYTNILKMRARVWGYNDAVWLANQDTIPQLGILSLAVGTGGGPVWMPSAVTDKPDMLLGRPIIFTEYCDTLGDLGDILCVNWTQYLDGLYEGLTGAESMHVRFAENESAFRFTSRNDGRCWWRSALTPKNSTNTLSPFVALAARA